MRWVTIVAVAMMGSTDAMAAETTVTLAIENMTCAACPITVRAAIKGVAGVEEVRVDFAKKVAFVVFDDARTNPDKLAVASRNAGFPATRKE